MYAWTSLGQAAAASRSSQGRINYEPQQLQFEQTPWHAISAMQPSALPGMQFVAAMRHEHPAPRVDATRISPASSSHYVVPPNSSQKSAPDDYQSDDSSDPNGHDLGFLSLSNETSASVYDDGTSSSGSGGQQQPSKSSGRQATDQRQAEHAASTVPHYIGSGSVEPSDDNGAEGGKRRRGRPVGSKDRQPRVKRMASSPQASDLGDKAGVCENEGRRKPWKIILTAEQAIEIYRKRTIGSNTQATSSCRSNEVAEQYGVNSKTIRDIWNRATWVKATRPAWTADEEADYVQSQQANNRSWAGPNDSETTRCSEAEDKGNETRGDGGDSKRTRGRPKGSRDMRPRVKRKSEWPQESEGLEGNSPASAAAHMYNKCAGVPATALDLQRLLAYPSIPLHQDKSDARKKHNSSSNTSQSQTSSYPTDDSHSGDQGSDSGGSGSGSRNSPPQAPTSPTVASRNMASMAGMGMQVGGVPALHAINSYAPHMQGPAVPPPSPPVPVPIRIKTLAQQMQKNLVSYGTVTRPTSRSTSSHLLPALRASAPPRPRAGARVIPVQAWGMNGLVQGGEHVHSGAHCQATQGTAQRPRLHDVSLYPTHHVHGAAGGDVLSWGSSASGMLVDVHNQQVVHPQQVHRLTIPCGHPHPAHGGVYPLRGARGSGLGSDEGHATQEQQHMQMGRGPGASGTEAFCGSFGARGRD